MTRVTHTRPRTPTELVPWVLPQRPTRPTRARTRRSGFITALAITMIALIAVALAMLTAQVNTLARQAAQERERAQAEELVLAGIEAVRADPAVRAMAVPDGAGSVKISARDGRLMIEAVVGRTRVASELDVKER